MIHLAGKIPSAKSCQNLGEAGKAEVLEVTELYPGKSQSVLSGQAADSRGKM